MPVNLDKIKKIHFVGIGGIGLSAIAKLMIWQGKKISGSDCQESEITEALEKSGAEIFIGHNEKNLDKNADLVACTLAVDENNPEIQKAEKLDIPILTYPEFLGLLAKDKFGIAVCGTHGKSTVTSMISLIFEAAGLDPTVVVGSKIPEFNGNVRMGKSEYFIYEACEYQRAFLNYSPKVIVLNNIELDHTDYYKDIEDYESAFEEFVGRLANDGVLIVSEQVKSEKLNLPAVASPQAMQAGVKSQSSKFKVISFGSDKKNDLAVQNIKLENGITKFNVVYSKRWLHSGEALWSQSVKIHTTAPQPCGTMEPSHSLGEFSLKVPGLFNVYNALAAISVALLAEIDTEIIKKTLGNFKSIWRRFEYIGDFKKAKIYSDYAHHPTEVKSTIDGARKFFPDKRIIAVFQPHQRNRTKKLFQDFIKSFDSADLVILNEIFDVAGREDPKDKNISSLDLVNEIKKRQKNKTVLFGKNLEETEKLILENIKKDDVVIIMGAGDVYKLNEKLKVKNEK